MNPSYYVGVLLEASGNRNNTIQLKRRNNAYFYKTGSSWKRVAGNSRIIERIEEAKETMRNRGLAVPGIIFK